MENFRTTEDLESLDGALDALRAGHFQEFDNICVQSWAGCRSDHPAVNSTTRRQAALLRTNASEQPHPASRSLRGQGVGVGAVAMPVPVQKPASGGGVALGGRTLTQEEMRKQRLARFGN